MRRNRLPRRFSVLALSAALVLGGLPSGCAPSGSAARMAVNIAYAADPQQSEDGLAIVTERHMVPKSDGAELCRSVMAAALQKPDSAKLLSPYPAGLQVQSVSYDDGVVTVDMNDAYRTLQGASLTLADYCTVRTLCDLSGVDGVIITADGAAVGGRAVDAVLRPEDAVYSSTALRMTEYDLTLYFPDDERGGLVRKEHKTLLSGDEDLASAVAQALLSGDEQDDGTTVRFTDENTRILSVSVSGGVCYLDLTSDFLSRPHMDESGQSLAVYAFVNSLCAVEGVDAVQFMIDGEIVQSYVHPEFSRPIPPDDSLDWSDAD